MGRIETDCAQAAELIGPYLDDDLPAETRRRLEVHLLRCQACAYEVASLRITKERLQGEVGEVIASDSFRSRVLTRLYADNPHLTTEAETVATEPEQFRLPLRV